MAAVAYFEVPVLAPPRGSDDVDEWAYLQANADVRASGMSARDHYVEFGQREGRMQWANQSRIRDLREVKLARLQFRYPRPKQRGPGVPMDFLGPDLRREFGIPDGDVPISSNAYPPDLIALIRANPDKLFLDLGAGSRDTYFSNVVNTEIYAAPSTDVLCVGEHLPFADAQFDYVLCLAVLEHTRRPWVVAKEIVRVLKPGGIVQVDYPFLQPLHGYPYHYFNATMAGSISLFEADCEILSCDVELSQTPIFSLRWMLEEWCKGLSGQDAQRFRDVTIGDIIDTPMGEHLSRFYCHNLPPATREMLAAGSTLRARKRVQVPATAATAANGAAEPKPMPVRLEASPKNGRAPVTNGRADRGRAR